MRPNRVFAFLCVAIFLLGFAHLPNAWAANYTILHNFDGFDGASPADAMVTDGNSLYGMTQFGGPDFTGWNDDVGSGVVFKIDADGTNYTIVHSFGDGSVANDGNNPNGSLLLSNSTLYGMTCWGGAAGQGTVFTMDTYGGDYAILHSFKDGTVPNDGDMPYGNLVLSNSTLYGMTSNGGLAGGFANQGQGVIFEINTDGSNYQILHWFGDGSVANDGCSPNGSLVLYGSSLYGMTSMCGSAGQGVAFKIDTGGSNYTILHQFADGSVPNDGKQPSGSFILSGTTLYGMTQWGGVENSGVIFKMNTDGSNYVILHQFGVGAMGPDGSGPWGTLALSGSTLYGMTYSGGTADNGVVFKVNTDGSAYQIFHSFGDGTVPNDGVEPYGSPTLSDSNLYGMTSAGGSNDQKNGGDGTIFSLIGAVSPVASFTANPTSGTAPLAVTFTDTSTELPTGWSWSFGDGKKSTSQNPVHTYTKAGSYTVTLIASNAAGSSSASQTITVNGPTVPGTPSIVSVTPRNASVTVNFTLPSDGGSPIKSCTATSNPGKKQGKGVGSPITVKGLTNGTSYTFTVTATNKIGTGSPSSPSSPVTPER